MRGSPCLHGALDQHGAPFFSEVSTEEGAQEGSQVRATHLTLLGTPTLWTFTPGDLTPSALSQPPQPPAQGPDTLCSVTPRESKPSAPSTLGSLHPPHRDPGQLGSLIMWRPPEQARSRNHSRCPRHADTTKDRKAAAQGQPTWRTVSPGNGGPSPQEEGSSRGKGPTPREGGNQPGGDR